MIDTGIWKRWRCEASQVGSNWASFLRITLWSAVNSSLNISYQILSNKPMGQIKCHFWYIVHIKAC